MNQNNLVFLAGKRTPFGSFGGSLKAVHPVELLLSAAKAALVESKIEANQIEHIIVGQVLYATLDSIYVPRHLGQRLGCRIETPALAVNRLCGSGFQTVIEAQLQMWAGDTQVALVGGVESMSQAPYVNHSLRWGSKMGNQPFSDSMSQALVDSLTQTPMAITAENLAEQYGISRDECDQFALLSQRRYQAAEEAGLFNLDRVLGPIKDEHPRSDATIEALKKLAPVFKKGGVVTAGNASGIVDGAATLIVSTENYSNEHGLNPIGRLVSSGVVGCDPLKMGIGPVPAIKIALKKAGMTLEQMEVIEINEAFAAQTLAVIKELGLEVEQVNPLGGAISVGHPLAASGTRILIQLLNTLRRTKKRFGLGTACIGGGQGIAIVVEAFH